MKNALLPLVFFLTSNIYAQNFYNQTGKSIGRIDANGNMYNELGQSTGRIDSSGNVYNQMGQSLGRVDSSGTPKRYCSSCLTIIRGSDLVLNAFRAVSDSN